MVMSHWKGAFPGRYRQVSDLDEPIVATVAGVRTEKVGAGENAEVKPVVHFREPEVKELVLNLTRAEAIAMIASEDDMDRWPGTRIKLYRGSTRYQGRRVSCIAVEAADNGSVGF
jgi:hypothetical protein